MIKVNVDKAKEISHEKRRAARAEEFKPLDVQATIPMFAPAAEEQRQEIRVKYEAIQAEIDAAKTAEELKQILEVNQIVQA